MVLLFDLIGVFAGGIVVRLSPAFIKHSWILALFPPILTVRGNVSGIFSGKLTTSLHMGEIRTSFRQNTEAFSTLIKSTFVLATVNSAIGGLLSFLLNYYSRQAEIADFITYLTIPVFVCIVSILFSLHLVTATAFLGFKKGLDPDISVYPIASTLNDVVVTFFFYVSVKLINVGFFPLLAVFSLLFAALSVFFTLTSLKDEYFIKTLKEGGFSILVTSAFSSFGGSILNRFRLEIKQFPGIIVIYPAIMDTLGDMGSIVGSMTTTKLAIGVTHSLADRIRVFVKDVLAVGTSAVLTCLVLGFVGVSFSKRLVGDFSLNLIKLLLFTNFLGFLVISVISFSIALGTFKKGWDPDNFVVPFVTSSADFLTTFLLFLGINLFL